MRMRKKKHRDDRIADCDSLFVKEKIAAGADVNVEIGCGKGGFICQLASATPEQEYIAIEKMSDCILLAAERVGRENIKNVRFINGDAGRLCEYFEDGSVRTIYLNFSDPWPKAGHSKRRLTYRSFLGLYARILIPGGVLYFKTDNELLFNYSLCQLRDCGWRVEGVTRDLHNSEYANDNICTEYETLFSEKGFKIKRLAAYPPDTIKEESL